MNTLSRLQAAGYQVQLEGEEIICRWQGPGKPDAAKVRPLLEELRQHKGEALQWLKTAQDLLAAASDWPEVWQERFEERAAIMEFDAGLPRAEAERRAGLKLVRGRHK